MNSTDQQSKFPTWAFILTDLALIGIAAMLAANAEKPLSVAMTAIIVGLTGSGVLFGLLPFMVRYEREKNEALDERQRALEALARTITASAEQISIATAGLHDLAEIAQRNLRHAEQLPHKLQEKIAEFQAQLATADDAEKEELERELLALRTTESERLESVSQRIAKSSAEWAKLEAATQQHLTAANEALAKLSLGTASAIGKAQAAAEQALAQARVEAARTLGEASGNGTRAIEAAKTAALAELEARLTAAVSSAAAQLTRELEAAISAQLAAAPVASRAAIAPSESKSPAAPAVQPESAPAVVADTAAEAPAAVASASEDVPAAAPKRPRKPRREEPAAPEVTPAVTAGESAPVSDASVLPAVAPVEEPAPIPVARIVEITPVAPATAEPFSGNIATQTNGTSHAAGVADDSAAAVAAATAVLPSTGVSPARKRAAKKPIADPEPGLDLQLDDTAVTSDPVGERVLTSDGATRLLVTAYIGIGNRLFIRGEGAGLSWEKGLPLQFVSIGKWRWETNDATAPVQFKIYKNDEIECAALGTRTLEPGHQQEVTATF